MAPRKPPATGPRRGSEQLELGWDVPPATPAANDFVCWLYAAFKPHENGRLNISEIARGIDVARSTVRRWVHSGDPRIDHDTKNRLIRRAILRGHGHYLWPELDSISRGRSAATLEYALTSHELISQRPGDVPPTWVENGTLEQHRVLLLYFPSAHVYGVASIRHRKSFEKLMRIGYVIESTTAPNMYAGRILKQLTLARVDEARCIAPRALVPTGRTETWLETAELPRLRKRLPKPR